MSFRLAPSQALGSTGHAVTGSGAFDLATSRGRAQLHQLTGLEQIIFLPQSVFVAQHGGGTLLPEGKAWISAGLIEQSPATNFPQFVTQVESLNPALLLPEIESGSVSVAPLAGVRGKAAYSVVINLSKAQAGVTGPSAAAFAKVIGYEMAQESGGTTPGATVEVLVDRQGRIAEMRTSPPGASSGTVTLALSGWGVVAAAAPPPPEQVVDISSLAPSGGDADSS